MNEDLISKGYTVVRNVIDPGSPLLDALRQKSEELAKKQVNPLDTLGVPIEPPFLDLITHAPTLNLLRSWGYDPKLYMAVFINKKPHEPKRPWHQDWWYWPDPIKWTDYPPQIGVMYYFTPTTKANGCLRVLPGSHKKWHTVHEHFSDATYTLADYEDEVAIEMSPGDVLFMDARLLHSTYANASGENRLAVNLWHIPMPSRLSYDARAHLVKNTKHLRGVCPDAMVMDDWFLAPPEINHRTYIPTRADLS